jgi:hypothetical protein
MTYVSGVVGCRPQIKFTPWRSWDRGPYRPPRKARSVGVGRIGRTPCLRQVHKKCTELADTGRHGTVRGGTNGHSASPASPAEQLGARAGRSQKDQTVEVGEVFEVLRVERRERDVVADAARRDPHVVLRPWPSPLLCAGWRAYWAVANAVGGAPSAPASVALAQARHRSGQSFSTPMVVEADRVSVAHSLCRPRPTATHS